MEAIRRKEQRDYNAKIAHVMSIVQGAQLGLPKKSSHKLLFTSDNRRGNPNFLNNSDIYSQMKTNDNFKNVEEYEHILKERNESFEERQEMYDFEKFDKQKLPIIDKTRSNVQTRLASNRVNSKQSKKSNSNKNQESPYYDQGAAVGLDDIQNFQINK